MRNFTDSFVRIGAGALFAAISLFPQPVLGYFAVPIRVFLGVLVVVLAFNTRGLFSRKDIPLWIFIALLLSGLYNAIDLKLAWTTYISLATAFVLAFYVGKGVFLEEKNWEEMAAVICICGVTVAIIAILEMWFGTNIIYEKVVDNPFYERYIKYTPRPMSTMFHPSIPGAYLLGCLPFCFYFSQSRLFYARIMGKISLIICAWVTVITFSRGAFLGLVALLLFYFWKIGKKKALIILAASWLLITIFCSFQKDHNFSRLGFRNTWIGNTSGVISPYRMSKIYIAGGILKDYPVLGIGLNHFRLRYNEYARESDRFKESYEFMIPDNMYLTFLTESGVVGLSGFLIFIIFLLRSGIGSFNKMQKTARRQFLIISLSALVGLLANMAGYEFFYWETPLFLFALICGFIQGITDEKSIA